MKYFALESVYDVQLSFSFTNEHSYRISCGPGRMTKSMPLQRLETRTQAPEKIRNKDQLLSTLPSEMTPLIYVLR